MRLNQRSYPHPVVGNRDDVPGAAFQSAIEMTTDKETVYLSATISCSSATINKLIQNGSAEYILHVECSNTLFRKAFGFSDASKQISIPADNLNDAVEVNAFVCAKKKISNYSVDKAHQDYGDATFEISKGDVLAVSDGHVFPIESTFDSMARIGSIMQIQESTKDGDAPMQVDFNGDKILIILSKQDFKDYKLLKNHEGVAGPLTTTVVLPVLVEALHQLKDEGEDEPGLRWARVLNRKLESLNLQDESDCLVAAQKLLELPLKRSLAASRQLAEASS